MVYETVVGLKTGRLNVESDKQVTHDGLGGSLNQIK